MIPDGYHSWRDEAILEARNGVPMTVHEGFRRSVAFLSTECWDDKVSAGHLIGTTFFVSVTLNYPHKPTDIPPHAHLNYAVTAKHCILGCADSEHVYIIVNKRGGGYKSLPTTPRDWVLHPQTDVAVCELPTSEVEILAASMPITWLIHKSKSTPNFSKIRLGDDVFTVGLYAGFTGSRSIQPIARFGRISLMPNEDEKIKVAIGLAEPEIEAYLIEVRGWEGQSGSPVFVSFGKVKEQVHEMHGAGTREVIYGDEEKLDQDPPVLKESKLVLRPEPVCIGLIQGYHPTELDVFNTADVKYKLNLGIAIVVPSEAIIEILMTEELFTKRYEARQE